MVRYGENEATYFGAEISKVNNANSGGVILEAGKYELKVNHIGISHERTRANKEPLAGADRTIFRSDLGKLMRMRELHDRTRFTTHRPPRKRLRTGWLMGVLEKGDEIMENGEKGVSECEKQEDFGHTPVLAKFMAGVKRC